MINAPQAIIDALNSDNVSYANLVTINLGDAYDTGSDVFKYLTDYGHSLSTGGNSYTPDNNLVGLAGISRKASAGSDAVDISFDVTDTDLIDVIKTERYINKPTRIDRVIIVDGVILEDFLIPVRTAWGLTHSLSGDLDDRTITLTIDSSLGDLKGDNGWYTINASHHQRYPNDDIMRHGATVMTDDQKKTYTANFKGVIDSEVKPPALSKAYGYGNVELVPICMLKHRKTHSGYRHYFTTMIYCVSIGEVDFLDIKNLRKEGEAFDFSHNTDPSVDGGGWSVLERTPNDATSNIRQEPLLAFWLQAMDDDELLRVDGMFGKGLTLLFVNNRNRDDWLAKPPTLTMPVRGALVYDPRIGPETYPPEFVGPTIEATVFSRNPALQYNDFLRSTEYGAGKRGIPTPTNTEVSTLANHFDQIPSSIGNDGINSILIDVQIDTGETLVDNMAIWMEGARLYTSDYYGAFRVRVETISAVDWVLDEDDLTEFPDYEAGDFTDKLNQLTYTVKQLVPDVTEGAKAGELVEVDVEATFPEKDSQIHTDWLAEDGGIPNFESESLKHVTDIEQALFWAMVDVRISRQPRELTLPVGPLGWLSEVGDIIDFTSEIMSMTNTLWRVDEVSEEDDEVELTLVAYADEFYTPDPNSIPAPPAPAQPPTGITLSPVSDLSIIEKAGLYYLDWTPLSSENVSWYAVEIKVGETIFIDEPKVAQPPLLLESLQVGDYTVEVTTVGIENESPPAALSFTVELPVKPTFSINVETFEVEIALATTSNLLGVNFELKINLVNDEASATSRGKASTYTLLNLRAETTYYLFAKTINIAGESVWATATFTTGDGQKYKDLVSDSLVDLEAISEELETIPRAWDQMVNDIGLIFSDAIGDAESLVNTQAIEAEAVTRASEIETLNDVTLPQLQADLATIDNRFPIQAVSIGPNQIQANHILANSITAIKIIAGAISADKLAVNSVGADKIVANAITAIKISAGAITSDKIQALAIISDLLAANSIIASKIAAGAITAVKIAAGAITADKIAANTITANEIAANIVLGGQAVFSGTLSAASGSFAGTISTGGALGFEVNTQGKLTVGIADIGALDVGSLDVIGSSLSRLLYVLNTAAGGEGIYAQCSGGGATVAINAFASSGIAIKATGAKAIVASGNVEFLNELKVTGNSFMGNIYSRVNNAYFLGNNNFRWQGVYSGMGNFTGNVTANSFTPFTGAHEGLVLKSVDIGVIGDIVVDAGLINIADISNTICNMEPSTKTYQKSISGILTYRGLIDVNELPKGLDDTPESTIMALTHDLIGFNALGEGAVNVCGENGDIEIGDFIVTSSMRGKGMKQLLYPEDVKSYTVAKSRQRVVFSSPDEVKQIAVYYRCG